jgi:hypothetical protein
MNEHERRALEALRFDWAPTPDDVWRTSPFHVGGLHEDVRQSIVAGIRDARDSSDGSPIGLAVQGQRGAGKTHLLGKVREQVQDERGYFFLVGLLDGNAFWETVASAMVEDLLRDQTGPQPQRQLTIVLQRLCEQAEVPPGLRAAVLGEAPLFHRDLVAFVGALRRLDSRIGLVSQDVAKALVLYGSPDYQVQDVGYQYLLSSAEAEPGDRAAWGLPRVPKPPQLIVRDISRLLALTGPSVIAVDQIDALIAVATKQPLGAAGSYEDGQEAVVLDRIADGLMSLRQITRRTLSIVACIPDSWILIKQRAVGTVPDRFREALQLHRLPNAAVARTIIEKRFGVRFREVGFTPPYPTWPVRPAAFDEARDFTPRGLLQCVDAHVQACLRRDTVEELTSLTSVEPAEETPQVSETTAGGMATLDARFAQLRAAADVASALEPEHEDAVVPLLLAAALTAWIAERGDGGRVFALDPPPSRKPALHARLRRELDEATEDEQHWAIRALASGNARAAQTRIRNACTMAGLRNGRGKRRVYLLRNTPWPSGKVTGEVVAAFADAGGVTLPLDLDDLRTFAALKQLLAERDDNLQAWLLARQPASGTALLRTILADVTDTRAAEPADQPAEHAARHRAEDMVQDHASEAAQDGAEPWGLHTARRNAGTEQHIDAAAEQPTMPTSTARPNGLPPAPRAIGRARVIPSARPSTVDPAIPLGVAVEDQRLVRASLESLRKHTAIFAGSGSGKTVLIRRLVEECALQGVSSIVLDPNNDLARLGDPWPARPDRWGPGDEAKATEYISHTDVVIWTPRRDAGRPLSFQPLPDFQSVRDDRDELRAAIEAAVAALAPRAKVDGRTPKASRGQAVLHEALQHFVSQGGSDLKSFVDLLSDLPEGVGTLGKADQIAAELAENLRAAMIIDPLFGGDGAPADPDVLLTPSAGKRARVSVISLIGLPADDQRQSFVNQLQMALFAWIKKNPAGDRPLGALFVMDEAQTFAPSGAMTPCTESTLALATQARKYGLGLVFATQAPKGLHNRIPGNAATQFFGFLNSPAQIEAAREMARAKGSSVLDISRLSAGNFYATGEGLAFQKVQVPMCLSHHPKSPLTTEEVIALARAG